MQAGRTALLIIDHGSVLAEANELVKEMARLLKNRQPDLIVHYAHMEIALPSIEDAIDACIQDGADNVVVHPFMLAPGRHASRDIPKMVDGLKNKYRTTSFRVTKPLGLHQKIADVILERAELSST